MSKKSAGLIVGMVFIPVVLAGLLIVHLFFYPLVASEPNFSDVEAVFSKLEVPATWEKTGEGANKGIAGRRCPAVESDGCFSAVATFLLPSGDYQEDIESVVRSLGCGSSNQARSTQIGGPATTNFRCSSGIIIVSGTVVERGEKWEAYVYASTK